MSGEHSPSRTSPPKKWLCWSRESCCRCTSRDFSRGGSRRKSRRSDGGEQRARAGPRL